MKVLVTVGSTGFDELVEAATSAEFLSKLYDIGYQHLTIQYGSGESMYHDRIARLDMTSGRTPVLEGYAYKSDIKQDMMQADLIISHAGSGSILESLRLHKKLIVVVNKRLLDNHQDELANVLERQGCLIRSISSGLADALTVLKTKQFTSFPEQDASKFNDFLDREMGYMIE
ncbi:hypothetical protein NQZ79_g3372 [Umbelopsis isabellina]|nr:hypothetical protein NQZ79_g3372 [Umbelopsis isabellina]